ncbi:hypothetical protein BS78_05G121300 [Paspalum vaginatum]|nr:hypothetical protein BS78_05G121300 [Paspalum vaginatum]
MRAFPAGGEGPPPRGAFRECVRAFLARCAVPDDGAWRVGFRVGGEGGAAPAVVGLEVVEEDVARAGAGRVYCEHCTVAGWSRHPVCGRRYHFIIRNEFDMHDYKTCRHCGLMAQVFTARKVSLMDVSKKYGIDYRILHAVTTGYSWYGQWGFKLNKGSFGITSEEYFKAIENLSSTPLSHFFPHSRSPRNQLQDTIAFYQSLSKRPLTTVRELFLYVLGLSTRKDVNTHCGLMPEKEHSHTHVQDTWTDDEIKRARSIALKVLLAVDRTRWVPLRTLKAAISRPVGSPQLVDYCLRTIGNITIDGMTVAVRCNSESKTLEYRLMDETILLPNVPMPTQDNLCRDIKFLHDALLYPHTMHPYKPEKCYEHAMRSAMVLLDCKQFTKHYDLEQEFLPQNPSMLHVWCQVELLDQDDDPPCIPTELLTLPQTATVADLKVEATRTFCGIYLMLQSFVATQLLDCGTASESTQLKLLFGSNGTVRVHGRCVGGERRVGIYKMERGIDKWTVHCSCGAKDDDGESMLSCDSCHVWQHTRCVGISDFDQVPKRYVCKSCKLLHKHKSSGPRPVYNSGPNKRCKIGTGAFSRVSGGFLRPHIS